MWTILPGHAFLLAGAEGAAAPGRGEEVVRGKRGAGGGGGGGGGDKMGHMKLPGP